MFILTCFFLHPLKIKKKEMSEHAFWVYSLYKLFQNNRILLAYKPKSSQNYDKGDRVFCTDVCLFVCLRFSSLSGIFHSYGDVTITGERLQI